MANLENLISITDFTNPYIVVANDVGESLNPYERRLNEIIAEHQNDILRQILGEEEFFNLENDNAGLFPTTQKWIDFINGTVYVKDGKNINYKGFKPALIRLMYYYYNVDVALVPIENGEATVKYDNAIQDIPQNKMVDAYNKAIDLIGYDYLCKFSSYYYLNYWNIYRQPFEYYTYYQDTEKYKPTVYNYLNDNEFDDWFFKNIEKINKFNI